MIHAFRRERPESAVDASPVYYGQGESLGAERIVDT